MSSVARVFFLAVVALVVACYSDAWLFNSGSSSGRASGGSFPHDVRTQSGLTSLYNQRVVSATHVQRPLSGQTRMVGPFRHSGVVVRTADGRRHLIHKGSGYGRSSQTVVTDARHMSSQWQPVSTRPVTNSRVADYVRAGGAPYSTLTNNCHHGRCRMMRLPA